MTLHTAAIALLETSAFSLVPVTPGAKAPPLLRWEEYQRRLPTRAEVDGWWGETPDANIAVVTGDISGITVIDLDGPAGVESAKGLGLPPTWTVKTPRGYHLYYEYSPDLHTGAGFLPGIDVRSDGGYVIAPPSVVGGKPYAVVRQVTIAAFSQPPSVLMATSRTGATPGKQAPAYRDLKAAGDPDWVIEAMHGVSEDNRNDTAVRLAGFFRHKGLSPALIYEALRPFAERCSPPMDLGELRRTVESVGRYPAPVGAGASRWVGGVPML